MKPRMQFSSYDLQFVLPLMTALFTNVVVIQMGLGAIAWQFTQEYLAIEQY
jgi:hypothetical protein